MCLCLRFLCLARTRGPRADGADGPLETSFESTVNPIKLETGLRPNSAGIPYTLLLRIEATGFPTFGLLL